MWSVRLTYVALIVVSLMTAIVEATRVRFCRRCTVDLQHKSADHKLMIAISVATLLIKMGTRREILTFNLCLQMSDAAFSTKASQASSAYSAGQVRRLLQLEAQVENCPPGVTAALQLQPFLHAFAHDQGQIT